MKRTLAASSLLVVALLMGCDQPPFAQPPAAAPPPAPVATPPQPVVAGVGVGQKGRSLDQYEGAVVTPAKSLFAVGERVVFEIQIPDALNKFEAIEGRRPKSNDEFMQRIIKENLINLPVLPPGRTYRWDPAMGEKGELMVDPPPAPAPATTTDPATPPGVPVPNPAVPPVGLPPVPPVTPPTTPTP